MKLDHKSAANRRNSCKSCGPRTAAGRETASRKALRHGLSAVVHRQPAPSAELERLAKAICGHKENRLCSNRLVAANELVLRAINVQKIAAVERLRDPTAIALVKGDNSLEVKEDRFHDQDFDAGSFIALFLGRPELFQLSVRLVEHCVDRAGCVDRRARTSTLIALAGRHFVSATNTETAASFLWFATIQCIESKEDLTGLAPKSCFITGETIECEVGQIGQARKTTRKVDRGIARKTGRLWFAGCRPERGVRVE